MTEPIPPIAPVGTQPNSVKPPNNDEEHLRLLAIFHYVVAGLAALFALFPIIHLVMGLFMVFAPQQFTGSGQQPPPAFIGWIFVVMGSIFITAGLIMAGLILTTGRFIARRKHQTFCFVMGCVECLFFPFGTALGVFTIVLLNRSSVKLLFRPAPSGSSVLLHRQ